MTFESLKLLSNSRRKKKHNKQTKLYGSTINNEKNLLERLSSIAMSNGGSGEMKYYIPSNTSTASVTDISSCNDLDSSVHVAYDEDFESVFDPRQMRCLALIAHNHMKPAMRNFVLENRNLLKKFRLTGTNTTMTMLKAIFRDDPNIVYGPTCSSGPLGGDAQVVAMMCNGDLGGVIFFVDPMSAHPHSADIECLNRQVIVHNIFYMNNPVSANAGAYILRHALSEGKADLIPSFFKTLESPCVAEYKIRQGRVASSSLDPLDSSMRDLYLDETAMEYTKR